MLMLAAIALANIAAAATTGTAALRRCRAIPTSVAPPTAVSRRNGIGVFTPSATGKKYQRPPWIGSPRR
jgi:hypothetical protein